MGGQELSGAAGLDGLQLRGEARLVPVSGAELWAARCDPVSWGYSRLPPLLSVGLSQPERGGL